MLEVELTGQRGHVAIRSGQNDIGAQDLRRQFSRTIVTILSVNIYEVMGCLLFAAVVGTG